MDLETLPIKPFPFAALSDNDFSFLDDGSDEVISLGLDVLGLSDRQSDPSPEDRGIRATTAEAEDDINN